MRAAIQPPPEQPSSVDQLRAARIEYFKRTQNGQLTDREIKEEGLSPARVKVLQKVYDILVKECGAQAEDRGEYIYLKEPSVFGGVFEYRFVGALGGEGKIWERTDGTFYVSGSSTASRPNPKTDSMVEKTNALLKEIVMPKKYRLAE